MLQHTHRGSSDSRSNGAHSCEEQRKGLMGNKLFSHFSLSEMLKNPCAHLYFVNLMCSLKARFWFMSYSPEFGIAVKDPTPPGSLSLSHGPAVTTERSQALVNNSSTRWLFISRGHYKIGWARSAVRGRHMEVMRLTGMQSFTAL